MELKWGLIGCGDVAEKKGGPALCQADGSTLVSVMSRSESKGSDFARRHGADRVYTSVEDLLSDEEANAIYVATPPHLHAEQTISAAEAGKHVLCEKPMAINVDECRNMVEAAAANDVQLMIAYYRRRFPAVVQMKKIIDDGLIGSPVLMRTQNAGRYSPSSNPNSWRTDPSIAGGGFLWDIGSHRIDLLLHLMGDISEVSAIVETMTHDIPVEDSASLLVHFESGAHGLGLFHWNIPRGADEIEIGGTEGRIVCDMSTGNVRLITTSSQEEWNLPPAGPTHLAIVEDLRTAIEEERTNCAAGSEGLKTNALLAASERSSKEKRFVQLAEIL
ncbi:MAG: Gfo/Idh/MocA family oxidoreductase [Planctomycetota bacterium]|nr:Gfo/Idh/MocA family oxidoreductase [Planctomycetota bacterium]